MPFVRGMSHDAQLLLSVSDIFFAHPSPDSPQCNILVATLRRLSFGPLRRGRTTISPRSQPKHKGGRLGLRPSSIQIFKHSRACNSWHVVPVCVHVARGEYLAPRPIHFSHCKLGFRTTFPSNLHYDVIQMLMRFT